MIIRGESTMAKIISKPWSELKANLLMDKEIKAEYDTLRPKYELIEQIILARTEQGITQAELAKRTGTKQGNISRFESGNYNPSLDFIQRLAQGLNKELHIILR
jgi:DNA-binding XRE family transcriptional regulator